jgi:hypothetical protein
MEQIRSSSHHTDVDACSTEAIMNKEEIQNRLDTLQVSTEIQIATVQMDQYDQGVASLVGRAAVLITVVHPDLHCNAGLAYAVLLPPGSSVWLVASKQFGLGWPVGQGAFKHGFLADLITGAAIRCVNQSSLRGELSLRERNSDKNTRGKCA